MISEEKKILSEVSSFLQKNTSSQVLGKAKNIVSSGIVHFSFQKGTLERFLILAGIVRESSSYETRISVKTELDEASGGYKFTFNSHCVCIDWTKDNHCVHSLSLFIKYIQQKIEENQIDLNQTKGQVAPSEKNYASINGVHVAKYGTIIEGPGDLKGGKHQVDYNYFTYILVNEEKVPFSVPVPFKGKLVVKFSTSKGVDTTLLAPNKRKIIFPLFELMSEENEQIKEVSLFESLYLYNWRNGDVFLIPNEIRDVIRKVRAYRYDYKLDDYLRYLTPLHQKGIIQLELDEVSFSDLKNIVSFPQVCIYSSSKKHFLKVVLNFKYENKSTCVPAFSNCFIYKDGLGESFSTRDEFTNFIDQAFLFLKENDPEFKKTIRSSSKRHMIDEYLSQLKNEVASFKTYDEHLTSVIVYDAILLRSFLIDIFDNWGNTFFKNSTYIASKEEYSFEIPSAHFFPNLQKFAAKWMNLGISFFYQDNPISYWHGNIRFERVSVKLDWFDLHMSFSHENYQMLEGIDLHNSIGIYKDNLILLNDEQKTFLSFVKKYRGVGKKEVKDEEIVYTLPFTRARIFEIFELQKIGGMQLLTDEELEICERLQSLKKIPDYPIPEAIKGVPRPYQKEGYNWMRFLYDGRLGACLADDMGLGKTFQTIIFLQSIFDQVKRILVVCPVSILLNWKQEFEKFSNMEVEVYHGGQRKLNANSKIIITSYGVMKKEMDASFLDEEFDVLILDEVQHLKNAKSLGAKAGRKLQAKFRLCLTGTPVENDVAEFYNILDLCVPGIWGVSSNFQKLANRDDRQFIKKVARPFILRRTKGQVITELPDKIENIVYLSLSETERTQYCSVLDEIRQVVYQNLHDRRYGEVLKNLLRLRQLCLWQKKQEEILSTKIEFLMENLSSIVEEGHKTLIFSQFTKYLDLIEEYVVRKGMNYSRIDGTQSIKKRQQEIDRFQNGDSTVFLISLKAGGVGLNLTAASYIFLMDPWWNPAVESQAIDRAHRIGQKNQVTVYRPIIKDSVEEKVLVLQDKKRELFTDLMSTGDDSYYSGKLTLDDFQFLFS